MIPVETNIGNPAFITLLEGAAPIGVMPHARPCRTMFSMRNSELAGRLAMLEAAFGAALRVLPVEAVEDVRAVLAQHVRQLPPLTDDEDAAVAGAVARLIGLN